MKHFAYGSNMDKQRMANRCPSARYLGAAVLRAYRFQIDGRGVATVVPDVEHEVHGVSWEISDSDLASLDRYEGVPKFYRKGLFNIDGVGGAEVMLCYLSTDTSIGSPLSIYIERIVSAAQQNKLPVKYIEELSSWMNAENS